MIITRDDRQKHNRFQRNQEAERVTQANIQRQEARKKNEEEKRNRKEQQERQAREQSQRARDDAQKNLQDSQRDMENMNRTIRALGNQRKANELHSRRNDPNFAGNLQNIDNKINDLNKDRENKEKEIEKNKEEFEKAKADAPNNFESTVNNLKKTVDRIKDGNKELQKKYNDFQEKAEDGIASTVQMVENLKTNIRENVMDKALEKVPHFRHIKTIINVIKLLFLVVLILIIGYIIYKIYHAYPRPRMLGKTAPIEEYMKHHVYLIVKYLHILKRFYDSGGSGGGRLRELVNVLFDEGIVPDELFTEYTPENAPYIYFNFMFKRALTGDLNMWKKNELTLIRRLTGMDTLEINGEEVNIYIDSETTVRDEVAEHIKKKVEKIFDLCDYFGEIDCSYKGQSYSSSKRRCEKRYKICKQKEKYDNPLQNNYEAELARKHLSYLLFRYSRDIEIMYAFRKSGGIANFVVYNLLMEDYVQFIFREQIPSIWNNFIERVKITGQLFFDVVTSEAVSTYMARLPLVIAGVDEFTQNADISFIQSIKKAVDDHHLEQENKKNRKKMKEGMEENNSREPIIENFGEGFGNIIKSLMMLLPNMLKIVLAFVEMITNPISIIRLLFGLIIGFALYIVYLVICIISPLFMIPAFIYVLTFSIIGTVAWLLLFIALAIIFFILWILDYATNGFVFSLLRCENLPDVWHEGPNYIFENINRRFFLCNYECNQNYLPAGFFCKRKPSGQPPMCPEQLIMSSYTHHALNREGTSSVFNYGPKFYNFRINADYINGNSSKKKDIIADFHDRQKKFSQKCSESLYENRFILEDICNNWEDFSIQNNVSDEEKEDVKIACYRCFCKYYFVKDGCRMHHKSYLRIFKINNNQNDSTDIESKFLSKIDPSLITRIRDELDKDMNNAGKDVKPQIRHAIKKLSDENSTYYIVNDGYDTDGETRNKMSNKRSSEIFHVPSAKRKYSFCGEFLNLEEPEIVIQRRKKGRIFILLVYALIILIMVSFGLIMTFNAVSEPKIPE